jgi:ABC transport system ATP-binding/permease protein
VLDEPTNDLDLETLELLEDLLLEYDGTLLLVSHDRELLNDVVTGTLALEGDGRVGEYAGGYDDWVRQRPTEADDKTPAPVEKSASRSGAQRAGAAERPRRLTFKERQELDALPASIEALETEQHYLYRIMADAGIYQQGGDEVVRASARLIEVEQDLAEAFARWEQLEAIAMVD